MDQKMDPRFWAFVSRMIDLCKEHGMELNGSFAVAITTPDDEVDINRPELESDTDILRNFEHIGADGYQRTLSRGNRA
jgi:hypothetical protein